MVFIIGPPAVGKMTAGQALERHTGFRLFRLHQVVDLLTEYFEYGNPSCNRLMVSYRALFFEEAARSGLNVITAGSWPFDEPAHTGTFWRYVQPYVERRGRVCFVELLAPLSVRLEGNGTENRRRHKKVDWSTAEHLQIDTAAHCYDSGGTLPLDLPFLRLETDNLAANATARLIADLSHRRGRTA